MTKGPSAGRVAVIAFVLVATYLINASCGDGDSPTQPSPACSFILTPAMATLTSEATSGTVAVTAPAGCTWSASTTVSWISISAGGNGSGPGAVTYAVLSNGGTESRSGQVMVAGQSHSVTQQGRPVTACRYDLSPASAEFSKDEARGTFAISAPAECAWTATSPAGWLVVTAGQGSGNGNVAYSVAANRDPIERTAAIAVADKTFTVRQAGDASVCQYSVAPVDFNPCMPSGSVTTTVTTQTGCSWTVTSNVSWLSLTSSSSGTGTAAITLSFSENYDAPREGIAMVRWPTPTAGQNVRVSQGGCVYTVTRSAFSFTAVAGSGSFDVIQQSQPISCGGATQDRCIWTAAADVSWIVVTTPMPQAGDGRVAFSIAANATGATRVGRIAVRDKVVVITQSQ
jgi:Viral BACON domain/Putative binding domain, N-terminal